jgi:ABC-type antimicrobial peptide transport system ATPase subunit
MVWLLSKYIVIIMMLVVFAMFWKGVEVLGPSNTNKDILYEGPKKTTEQRWQDAYEWMKKRENKSK